MKHSLRLAAFISTFALPGLAYAQAGAPVHLEAEAAQLSGNPTVQTARAGYSGAGYVAGFTKDGDTIRWTLANVAPGLYQIRVRYNASSPKGYDVVVNGHKTSAMFAPSGAGFDTAVAGRVELPGGVTTLAIEKGWGYYEIDALDLVPVTVDQSLTKPPATLSDAAATPAARALMRFLVEQYGARTLSGQVNADDNAYIRETTGQTPAIFGGDFMDYSPSRLGHGAKPEGTSEQFLQRARDGQILALMWHWNAPSGLIDATYTDKNGKKIEAPWYRGFYSDATTFDLQKALANPGSEDYKLLLRDIVAIAVQLQKFSDAGVPVLWRPLHEAEGGWFWWGAKGPEPFVKLWRLMHDRLTQTHHLHNLIWVYTAGSDPAWYPGDDVVDIVGADAYPSDYTDPLTATWDDLIARYGGRKLIALTEVGKVPDVAKMRRLGVKWAYFTSWGGDLGPKPVPKATLQAVYTTPAVLNRDALPAQLSDGKITEVAAAPVASTTVAPALAPTPANYRLIQSQVEQNLQTQVLGKWFPAAVNDQIGGFDQNFSENWINTSSGTRSIVYQARLTWLASQMAMRSTDPAQAAHWKSISAHGADFLRTKMWDARNGGFFWELDAQNTPARKGEKHAYGNAFAIYALAANYRATGDARSLALAQNAFRWLDGHAHDARSGGYFEAFTRAGAPLLLPPAPDQTGDFIGTRYGYKSMNTHIHLLEALAALHEVWPDPTLTARLREVFGLVRDTIVVSPPGAMNLFFTPQWKAVPGHDSFGHDIETAYLLVEAAQSLGMPDDGRTWQVARSLVDHTLDFGLDKTSGGFYDGGDTFGGISTPDKVWWTQAEALNALLLMHAHYGAFTSRYWDAFVGQWNFIQQHQIDPVNGGWYRAISGENAPVIGATKSDEWTEAYHQGRALLNVAARLGRLSAGSAK